MKVTLPDIDNMKETCEICAEIGPIAAVLDYSNRTGDVVASVMMELKGNKLVLYAWIETDEGDPTVSLVLVKDVKAAFKRKFDENGNVIKETK